MKVSEKTNNILNNCRFCWMCRHICPIGNATGQERNTARARAMCISLVVRDALKMEDAIDNIYECSLCGACTNNCVTGFDPKVFTQETKTKAILDGIIPSYIKELIEKNAEKGNVYGLDIEDDVKALLKSNNSDTLVILGTTAIYKSKESVFGVANLLNKAGVKVDYTVEAQDTGADMWFLTGTTNETKGVMEKCAEVMNRYKTVVVYNPVDLRLIKHEYAEYGIMVKANVISFNEYLLELIKDAKIKPVKKNVEYTLQDNYAYARDLDDVESGRKLISYVGNNKEMLLIGKEANMAGSLLMAEYMPEVQRKVAEDRWFNAYGMDCKNIVTENPDEYELMKATLPEGYTIHTLESLFI